MTDSNNYSTPAPRDIVNSNTYSIPSSVPRDIFDSNAYSIPSSIPATANAYINHTIETHVTVEPNGLANGSEQFAYQHPRGSGGACEVVLDQKAESGDYIYMSGCPDEMCNDENKIEEEVHYDSMYSY